LLNNLSQSGIDFFRTRQQIFSRVKFVDDSVKRLSFLEQAYSVKNFRTVTNEDLKQYALFFRNGRKRGDVTTGFYYSKHHRSFWILKNERHKDALQFFVIVGIVYLFVQSRVPAILDFRP